MAQIPVVLYVVLFLTAMFAPLRWSIVGFLLLSNIDFGSLSAGVGMLNTAKAMILPVFMLWRFRAYSGHEKVGAATIAWSLLIIYVAIASLWSLFPSYAIKLVAHMVGSLVICMVLVRATKGGYLSRQTVLPVAVGTLGIAFVHWKFLHNWGGEPERFTTFAGAQSFAALSTALYCAALSFRSLRLAVRVPLCLAMAAAVLLNGSRIWVVGLFLSTFVAVVLSSIKLWIKIVAGGMTLALLLLFVLQVDPLMRLMAKSARANRVAAAISAAYSGYSQSRVLGTFALRHELFTRTVAGIEGGSATELIFGHGTCNGARIAATLSKNPDPNRALHDEWLRATYEWGLAGLGLWLWFIGSLVVYAAKGIRKERFEFAKPLLIYLPAFGLGLTGENMIAGAGNAVSVGLLLLIAFASISHRRVRRYAKQSPNIQQRSPRRTAFHHPAGGREGASPGGLVTAP